MAVRGSYLPQCVDYGASWQSQPGGSHAVGDPCTERPWGSLEKAGQVVKRPGEMKLGKAANTVQEGFQETLSFMWYPLASIGAGSVSIPLWSAFSGRSEDGPRAVDEFPAASQPDACGCMAQTHGRGSVEMQTVPEPKATEENGCPPCLGGMISMFFRIEGKQEGVKDSLHYALVRRNASPSGASRVLQDKLRPILEQSLLPFLEFV